MDKLRGDDLAQGVARTGTRRVVVQVGLGTAAASAIALAGLGGGVSPAGARRRSKVVQCRDAAGTQTFLGVTGQIAQTFRAPETGRLTKVTVRITTHPNDPGDYVAWIVPTDEAGAPLAKILAKKTVPDGQVSGDDQPVTFTFGGAGARVRRGRRYAVVVGRSGGSFSLACRMVNGGDPCPGSDLFTDQSSTGSFLKFDGHDAVFDAVVRYDPS